MAGRNRGFIMAGACLAAALAAAAVLLFVWGFHADGAASGKAAASVNGEPVDSRELSLVMAELRPETMDYFYRQYGADVNKPGFWKTDFSGEVPLKLLKDKALKRLVRLKVEELQARDAGAADDISYGTFLRRLDEENKQRREKLDKHEVVFGPKQFTERTYFNYTFQTMVNELKNKLAADRFDLSDSALTAYYETVKAERFRKPADMTVRTLSVRYSAESGGGSLSEQEAADEVRRLKDRLSDKASFEAFADEAASGGSGKYAVEERTFKAENRKDDGDRYPALLAAADSLDAGGIGGPFKDADRQAVGLILVEEKAGGGVEPFEAVKDTVRVLYTDKLYEEWIDRLAADAEVTVNPGVYDDIQAPAQ